MTKIDDVARLAGVSKGTVSNVFSQKRPTSKAVADRVLRASRELNYVPNQVARSLVTKRTMAIGLTVPHGNFFVSAFHNQFINGVVLEASSYGYRVLLDMISTDEVKTPSLASYPIDGAIVLGPTEEDERIGMLYGHRIPFVTVGKIVHSATGDAPTVNNDNQRVMTDIVDYLANLGHRGFLFLNAGERTTVGRERTGSFADALTAHGINPHTQTIRYKPDIYASDYLIYGYKETLEALGGPVSRTTAIIADDDRTAYSAINAVKELGLRIPEDVSLFVICGDLSMMNQATPALTGMDLQPSELGVHAVKLLMHKLSIREGGYSNHWIVSSHLIERSSCAPAGGSTL